MKGDHAHTQFNHDPDCFRAFKQGEVLGLLVTHSLLFSWETKRTSGHDLFSIGARNEEMHTRTHCKLLPSVSCILSFMWASHMNQSQTLVTYSQDIINRSE